MDALAQLSAWIDPVELLDVLLRIESGETALRRQTICLPSDVLDDGSVGGFSDMVVSYLRDFSVPNSLITLTTSLHDCSDVSDRALAALTSLRFDGAVASHARKAPPPGLPVDTVLSIECAATVADLISYPCRALLDLVSASVGFWAGKRHFFASAQVHSVEVVPSAASRLQVAVDQVVAKHFGAQVRADNFDPPRLNLGFRSLTFSSSLPTAETLVTCAQESARRLAEEAGQEPV